MTINEFEGLALRRVSDQRGRYDFGNTCAIKRIVILRHHALSHDRISCSVTTQSGSNSKYGI